MGHSSSKQKKIAFPTPVVYGGPPQTNWSTKTRKGKERAHHDYGYPNGYQPAAYGYQIYPQIQPVYPQLIPYYPQMQMGVIAQPVIQQPIIQQSMLPQNMIPQQSANVMPQPANAAPTAMPQPAAPMPVPNIVPEPAGFRMPEPYGNTAGATSQAPVVPPTPANADPVIPPPPIISSQSGNDQRAGDSARLRFENFYRPAEPPISQPQNTPQPFSGPSRTDPLFRTPMRNNPLPQPPKDIWDTTPYRDVLAHLPTEISTLMELHNREDIRFAEQEPASTSRLGSLFGRGKKTRKGLFRSSSNAGNVLNGDTYEDMLSRPSHRRANTVANIFIPASESLAHGSNVDRAPSPVLPMPSAGDGLPPIKFDHTGELGGFVNHSRHRVLYKNKQYPTALHLLEAMKFMHHPDLAERIRTCDDVLDMYPLSASLQEHVRGDWGHVFLKTMEDVLYLKFKQHPNLRRLLLDTGLANIVYQDINSYWGEGPSGEGANELGKALVRVRERLRMEQ